MSSNLRRRCNCLALAIAWETTVDMLRCLVVIFRYTYVYTLSDYSSSAVVFMFHHTILRDFTMMTSLQFHAVDYHNSKKMHI